jgi:hypothetical protein
MAFRVARMARVKSGAFKARKGIPADVREGMQRSTASAGKNLLCTLGHTFADLSEYHVPAPRERSNSSICRCSRYTWMRLKSTAITMVNTAMMVPSTMT